MVDQDKERLYNIEFILKDIKDHIVKPIMDHIDKSIKDLEERLTRKIESKNKAKSAFVKTLDFDELLKDWSDDKKDVVKEELKSKSYNNIQLKDLCAKNNIKIKARPTKAQIIEAIISELNRRLEAEKEPEIPLEEVEGLRQKFNEYSRTWASAKEREEEKQNEEEVMDELKNLSEEYIRRLFDANHLEVKGSLSKENMLKAMYAKFRERRRY
ncbi:MAG: hypothetical protein HQL06_05930 [Nitrospirae bacterium]|nr:hypothetical protein [Nitrospirota bacterium]